MVCKSTGTGLQREVSGFGGVFAEVAWKKAVRGGWASQGWLGCPCHPGSRRRLLGLGTWGALVGVAEQSKCLSLELQKAPS